jgi:hypothetical protein
MIRFPLSYRVGEAFRLGNAVEGIRCEAGANAWLEEDCPTAPIPHLFGFGQFLLHSDQFTALEDLPLVTRRLQISAAGY